MRIVLTGFMGAGKTTVGRELSRLLRWPFVDLDEEIERRAGQTIREIFETQGEAQFRQLERQELERALQSDSVVVAAGGGTLAQPANLDWVSRLALVIWIKPEFSVMARRIASGRKRNRPLFRDELSAWKLYQERLPSYGRADLTVEVAAEEVPASVARRIVGLLQERRCNI